MTIKKARRALGRGLSNLIPVIDDEQDNNSIVEIARDKILPNPFQPRKTFNDEDILELANSISSQGLLQPIVVRKQAAGYEIVSGERRFRALKHLGKQEVPCIIKDRISDTQMLEMALVENIQRENLNDIEVADSYQSLLFQCGLSHQELSERVGRSRSAITNTLRLLKLPEEIQARVRDGAISSGHARALLSIKDPASQAAYAKKIVDEKLTVRDIELVGREKPANKSRKEKTGRRIDPDVIHQEEQLRYRLGTDVKIVIQNGDKGKIEIPYYTKDDLNRVLTLMLS